VLRQGLEGMAAAAIGDEKILSRHGMQHGLDRRQPRIADRPRRQSLEEVGVVGFFTWVRAADLSPQRSLAIGDDIDDRGVGLQHAAAQAIDEDAGDMGSLRRQRGLLLHDRGQHQRLVDAVAGQIGGPLRPELGEGPAHPSAMR
jgi:hypothetical protein